MQKYLAITLLIGLPLVIPMQGTERTLRQPTIRKFFKAQKMLDSNMSPQQTLDSKMPHRTFVKTLPEVTRDHKAKDRKEHSKQHRKNVRKKTRRMLQLTSPQPRWPEPVDSIATMIRSMVIAQDNTGATHNE